jgi:hypothetical protein
MITSTNYDMSGQMLIPASSILGSELQPLAKCFSYSGTIIQALSFFYLSVLATSCMKNLVLWRAPVTILLYMNYTLF